MRIKHTIMLGSLALLLPAIAAAQAPPVTPSPPTAAVPAPSATQCAPSRIAPEQGTITSPNATTGQAREPLGDRLARSDGVICPPAGIDTEMRIPAPDVGTMPVIPPPGSPGGTPNAQPK
uniref:Uncharacterized protein n=1 Tax=Rhodopseudomonas palustris (strain BisA53) TaxID=316055 RepID=Q07SU2_RHOP5